ncbi:MAG: hypothetical protein SF051_08530 [Elusimicrobiota bacterium]|nr:hypothetical protein [Elusimicrobiota bacterium]
MAHVLTALLDRAGSELWLKGPYGPPFFNISVYTAVFYGAIGAAATRRAREGLIGFFGPLLTIVLPMAVLSRVARLGFFPDKAPSIEWQAIVAAVYLLAIWGTIAALGASGVSRRRAAGAAAAVAGSLVGYAFLNVFTRLVPSYAATPWNPAGLIPSPINLMDGLLSGAALSLAVLLVERRNHAR